MIELLAAHATPILREFNRAGVLSAADVQVARRLGALTGEDDESVVLAVALTVRGTRHGSVVLDLDTAAQTVTADVDEDDSAGERADVELDWPQPSVWIAAAAASPLVTGPAGSHPVVLAGGRMWLDRYWQQEASVADQLLSRSADKPDDLDLVALRGDLDALFGRDAGQRRAAAVSVLSRVSVIAGGPGTGKTTTVARLLTLLWRQHPELRVALAAPTGKAAARLTEAVHAAGDPLTPVDVERLHTLTARTLHRLLGRRPDSSTRFRHDHDNHVPYDVVVVDESSMIPLTLMARLLEALGPGTRLVLVGDPDQLVSVEAGAVLGDLVDQSAVGPVTPQFGSRLSVVVPDVDTSRATGPGAALRESVTLLRTVHRFDAGGPIAELARLVRDGFADDALTLLRSAPDGLAFDEVDDDEPIGGGPLAHVATRMLRHERAVITAAEAGDIAGALDELDRHRLLCAHRSGARGVRPWSAAVERWLIAAGDIAPRADARYAGQPLLVTSNDYELGLWNGDTGVIVAQGAELAAAFRRGGEPIVLPLVRLGDVRTLHAMTVHRAQGSQFDDVTVLLAPARSPLATRQTFYTAVTRAASTVRIVGSEQSVIACVRRQAARATGLRARLDGELT